MVVAIAVVMTPVVAVVPVAVVPVVLVVLDRGGVGGGVSGGVTASRDGGGVGDPCTGVAGDVDLQGDGRVAVPGRQDVATGTGEGGQNAVPSPAGDPVGPKTCGEDAVDGDRGAMGRAGRGDVTHSDGVDAVLAPGEGVRVTLGDGQGGVADWDDRKCEAGAVGAAGVSGGGATGFGEAGGGEGVDRCAGCTRRRVHAGQQRCSGL